MVVNPVPHNVPDAINPQEAINQNLNVIRDILLELDHDNIPDNQLFQDPDAVQIIIINCMTCIGKNDEKYIVLPCGHAWVCVVCVVCVTQFQ